TIIGNYIAGSGTPGTTGACGGGGTLMKYGANRVSFYGNFYDKNLRRNPTISAESAPGGIALADIRWNYVRNPVQSVFQIVEGAEANLIANYVESDRNSLYTGGIVHFDDASAFPVPALPGAFAQEWIRTNSGALPRDAIDTCYVYTAKTYF